MPSVPHSPVGPSGKCTWIKCPEPHSPKKTSSKLLFVHSDPMPSRPHSPMIPSCKSSVVPECCALIESPKALVVIPRPCLRYFQSTMRTRASETMSSPARVAKNRSHSLISSPLTRHHDSHLPRKRTLLATAVVSARQPGTHLLLHDCRSQAATASPTLAPQPRITRARSSAQG